MALQFTIVETSTICVDLFLLRAKLCSSNQINDPLPAFPMHCTKIAARWSSSKTLFHPFHTNNDHYPKILLNITEVRCEHLEIEQIRCIQQLLQLFQMPATYLINNIQLSKRIQILTVAFQRYDFGFEALMFSIKS